MNPCPFCNNKDLKKIHVFGRDRKTHIGWHIVCEPEKYPCGAQGPITNTERSAKKAWNKRGK